MSVYVEICCPLFFPIFFLLFLLLFFFYPYSNTFFFFLHIFPFHVFSPYFSLCFLLFFFFFSSSSSFHSLFPATLFLFFFFSHNVAIFFIVFFFLELSRYLPFRPLFSSSTASATVHFLLCYSHLLPPLNLLPFHHLLLLFFRLISLFYPSPL